MEELRLVVPSYPVFRFWGRLKRFARLIAALLLLGPGSACMSKNHAGEYVRRALLGRFYGADGGPVRAEGERRVLGQQLEGWDRWLGRL